MAFFTRASAAVGIGIAAHQLARRIGTIAINETNGFFHTFIALFIAQWLRDGAMSVDDTFNFFALFIATKSLIVDFLAVIVCRTGYTFARFGIAMRCLR
jgi:uncharacterized membrane protein